MILKTIHTLFYFAVPSDPPSEVTLSALNSTALWVNITLPPRDKRNGIIIGYKVQLTSETNEVHIQEYPCSYIVQWNKTELFGDENVTRVVFGGLRPYFDYTCTVQAFTRVGLGPLSDPILEKTAETGMVFVFFKRFYLYL